MKKKKKQRRKLNWNLIRDRMMAYVVDKLTEAWDVPIILDVFEYKQIPFEDRDCAGCMGCVIDDNGELYINHIAIKKQSKENMIYTLAHELGHILDSLQLHPKELIAFSKANNACNKKSCSELTTKDKRVFFEGEKRAYSEGLILLQRAGLRNDYYLQRYLKSRQKGVFAMMIDFFGTVKKKRKKIITNTIAYNSKGSEANTESLIKI